jgi:hypothetical protein
MVYSKLGLQSFSNYPINITPDYTKTLWEVLLDASKAILENDPIELYGTRPMQPLRESSSESSSDNVGLPTWASAFEQWWNFEDDAYQKHVPKSLVLSFAARVRAEHTTPELRGTKFPSLVRFIGCATLKTVGKLIGTIVDSSGEMADAAKDKIDSTWTTTASMVHRVYDETLKPLNVQARALSEAFIAGIDESMQPYYHVDDIRLFFDQTANESGLTNEQCNKLVDVSHSARGQIIFVTSEGCVGMAYHPEKINGIRRGDVVVGLFGINLPFVLRHVPDSGSYEMINIAYVGEHQYSHPALVRLPEETTEDDIWDNLQAFGLEQYTIV